MVVGAQALCQEIGLGWNVTLGGLEFKDSIYQFLRNLSLTNGRQPIWLEEICERTLNKSMLDKYPVTSQAPLEVSERSVGWMYL